jgi:hypothetical protein
MKEYNYHLGDLLFEIDLFANTLNKSREFAFYFVAYQKSFGNYDFCMRVSFQPIYQIGDVVHIHIGGDLLTDIVVEDVVPPQTTYADAEDIGYEVVEKTKDGKNPWDGSNAPDNPLDDKIRRSFQEIASEEGHWDEIQKMLDNPDTQDHMIKSVQEFKTEWVVCFTPLKYNLEDEME